MEASTLVIFGATGDLTHRKLMPALYHLSSQKLLPKEFNIVGFARRELTNQTFVAGLKESLQSIQNFDLKTWKDFSKKLFYLQGDFAEKDDYLKLARFLKKFDSPGSCTNKIFYLATAPSYFDDCIRNLEESEVHKLLGDCWFRVIIEKPFGHDLESAKALNKLVDEKFSESNIYRIDHYLAKETVQNILTFRFANGIFEPLWNREYIDHIQITAAEKIGVENRGPYYEESGNLRDIVQNHLLQLLALTTMEQPRDFAAESIRDARLAVLESLRKFQEEDLLNNIVFGQYTKGDLGEQTLLGYRQESRVSSRSETDTFTALRLFIDNPRWQNVPVYLRSGKRLADKTVDISILFKEPENRLFPEGATIPNVLSFHIQPDEGISVRIMTKEPGHEMRLAPVSLHLKYEEVFSLPEPEPYEKLVLDIIQGVQTLFPRCDEVEASWDFVDPIIKAKDKLKIYFYPAGSWGPEKAQELIAKDGRGWFTH